MKDKKKSSMLFEWMNVITDKQAPYEQKEEIYKNLAELGKELDVYNTGLNQPTRIKKDLTEEDKARGVISSEVWNTTPRWEDILPYSARVIEEHEASEKISFLLFHAAHMMYGVAYLDGVNDDIKES